VSMNRTDRLYAWGAERSQGRRCHGPLAEPRGPARLRPGRRAEVAAVATALAATTPFTHAGRSALQKILAVLREVDAHGAYELASRVRIYDTGSGPRPPGVVEHAIVQRRVLRLDYVDKTGSVSERVVEPVAVLGVQPNWYLWTWCRLRHAPRSFRLDRIRGAVMSEEVAPERGMDVSAVEVPDLIGRGILAE
ncbi:MAG: helix-turn-helix transcriptional regulator, partial [Ilumatobacteraceae bacterium]